MAEAEARARSYFTEDTCLEVDPAMVSRSAQTEGLRLQGGRLETMVPQAVSALYLWRKVAAGAVEGTMEIAVLTMQAEMEDQVGVEAPA